MSNYRDGFNEVQREGFWSLPRVIFAFVILILVCGGLTFIGNGVDLANYKFWAPKQQEAQRQVARTSASFVDGMAINLGKQIEEYQTADAPHKIALRQRILDESRQIDPEKLPADEQSFIEQLKEGRQ